MNLTNLKNLPSLLKSNPLLVAFLVLGVVAFFMHGKTEEVKSAETAPREIESIDTRVPAGYVLISVQIANGGSLSSLVGDVGGVVDLYLAATETRKGGLKVGSRLKLLRSSNDPNEWSVLLRESESARFAQYLGPFIAVVQNPNSQGSQLSSSGPSRVKIDYQN